MSEFANFERLCPLLQDQTYWQKLEGADLEAFLYYGIVHYGMRDDAAMIAHLARLYEHCITTLEAHARRRVLEAVLSFNTPCPFVTFEPEQRSTSEQPRARRTKERHDGERSLHQSRSFIARCPLRQRGCRIQAQTWCSARLM
jgi:hypothetical protein